LRLSLSFIRDCNIALLKPFYPRRAGVERSQPRTLVWPHRMKDGTWGEILTEATRLNEVHSELANFFRDFEQSLPNLKALTNPDLAVGVER